jgi:hypothetical protein
MNVISERKKYINKSLGDINNYPATSLFKQEMMAFSYVLVCGAIEYMIEILLQDWLNKTIKHHNVSSYRGKKYIQNFLEIQSQAREKNIANFHSTKLSEIKALIANVAGESAKDKFSKLLDSSQQSSALQPDINSRLDRISKTRHYLAHGEKIPLDIQPNISELLDDFNFVYKYIIVNIKKSLPRM